MYQQKISTFVTDNNFLILQQILLAYIKNIYNKFSINVMLSLIIVRPNVFHKLTPHSLHSKHNLRLIKTRFPPIPLQKVLIRQHIK